MMSRRYGYITLLCLLLISVHATAYAADAVTWESALDKIVKAVQITARPIVAITVAVTGLMVLYDFDETPMKTMIHVILGIGIVLQVADLITGDHSLFEEIRQVMAGEVVKPIMPILSFSGPDKGLYFVRDFMIYGQNLCVYGATMLVPHALKLLGGLTIIEVTMEMVFKMQADPIRYLLHTILKIGFFIFLIQNWLGGTGALMNITETIFTSFENLGIIAGGGVEVKAEHVLVQGFEIIRVLSDTTMSASSVNMLLMSVGMLIELGIFACIIITALQYMITQMEFWIIAMLMVPLLPLGISKHTRYFFEVAVGTVFNLGLKMCVISFIFTVVSPMINIMVYQLDHAWQLNAWGANIILLLQIFVGLLLFATMTMRIPKLASVFLYGQPSLTAGDMLAPVRTAAKAVNISRQIIGTFTQASYMPGGAMSLKQDTSGTQIGWGERQVGTLKNLALLARTAYSPSRSTRHKYQDGQTEVRQRMVWNPVNTGQREPAEGVRQENTSTNTPQTKNADQQLEESKIKK